MRLIRETFPEILKTIFYADIYLCDCLEVTFANREYVSIDLNQARLPSKNITTFAQDMVMTYQNNLLEKQKI
jgi:hypothetical protein